MIMIGTLSFILFALTPREIIVKPLEIELSKYYFSSFNSVSRGGSLNLADTSLIVFGSTGKYILGLGLNAGPFAFSNGRPLSIYCGKNTGDSRFVGFSLSGMWELTQTSYLEEVLGKDEAFSLYPAFFYSVKDLNSTSIFRMGFPYEKDILITPTDTSQVRTRYSVDLGAYHLRELSPQWAFLTAVNYVLYSRSKSLHTVQELLDYDSTTTNNSLNLQVFTLYTPFRSTFLALGPVVKAGSEYIEYGLVSAGEYEWTTYLSLEGIFGYYFRYSESFQSGVERSAVTQRMLGPLVGMKVKKDFLSFEVLYDFCEERFSAISLKFTFVR